MPNLSLREAAEQAGVSKSTIFRAIQSGRMSAARNDDGNFAIDPSELFRVYPPKPSKGQVADNVPTQAEPQPMGQSTTAVSDAHATELRIRNAQLEEQLKGLQAIVEAEKHRSEQDRMRVDQQLADLRAERDRWAAQAERLALTGPQQRRGLLGWLRRA